MRLQNHLHRYYSLAPCLQEGNEKCAVRLERLMADELDHYVISETGLIRELEKSTTGWATLYLFQTRSHYQSPEDRAEALTTLFLKRDVKTERTFRKQ
jgi:hypothetical protein